MANGYSTGFVGVEPGRFRVVPIKKTGRRPGSQRAVAQKDRDPTRSYCKCGRRLNSNNRSGICRTCAPHGYIQSLERCFQPYGHRWRTVMTTNGTAAKQCVNCGQQRMLTDREAAARRIIK